jgi:hypothetical protein
MKIFQSTFCLTFSLGMEKKVSVLDIILSPLDSRGVHTRSRSSSLDDSQEEFPEVKKEIHEEIVDAMANTEKVNSFYNPS